MKHQKITVEREQISINPDDVHSLLGTSEGEEDHHSRQLIDRYISECRKVSQPMGGFISISARQSSSNDEIAIEGTLFQTGKIIRKMLQRSDTYAFFVATAGYGPEELSRSLINEGNYLEGYIADLVASAIAESVAIRIHEHIKLEAGKNGIATTNRYSPGYCGWEVFEQQKLFSLFPEGWCGVTLSESSLMSPIKSVSGVIGTGASVSFRDYTCEICSMKECVFRRTRTTHPHHSPE